MFGLAHLATFFLLCPSALSSFVIDIASDLISFSHIKCVIVVIDDPGNLGRDIFKQLEVQSRVVLKTDLWQMQNLTKMGNCGVFLRVKEERSVSEYINTVFQVNSLDNNIFKTLHWFIFLGNDIILDPVFRYDSNVYLVREDTEEEDIMKIVETYSIEDGVQINKDVGTWSSKHRLGDKECGITSNNRESLVVQEPIYLKRRMDLMGKTMRSILFDSQRKTVFCFLNSLPRTKDFCAAKRYQFMALSVCFRIFQI